MVLNSASAMMLRAELPVHNTRICKGRCLSEMRRGLVVVARLDWVFDVIALYLLVPAPAVNRLCREGTGRRGRDLAWSASYQPSGSQARSVGSSMSCIAGNSINDQPSAAIRARVMSVTAPVLQGMRSNRDL